MKKSLPLFLAVLFILPSISVAGDSYDSTTGIVTMPNVSVGTTTFDVKMQHQGNLVFKVTSATPRSPLFTTPDTFDSATGVLHIPNVAVGADNFEVDMMHQGDLVFSVTSAPQVNFKFTTDYLDGKTFYDVYYNSDDGKWEIATFSFTGTTFSAYDNNNPNDKLDNEIYGITSEGYITFPNTDEGEGDTNYVKATSKTDDYFNMNWESSLENINKASGDYEYFFFDLQKAQNFIDAKDAEVAETKANTTTVTMTGTVSFVDSSGNAISVPSDAGIRIIANNDYQNDAISSINSDGTFSVTKTMAYNTFVEGNSFSVTVFKNHINPNEVSNDCGEDSYKGLVSQAFDSWININVSPSDYQDHSSENCTQ